MGENDHIDGIKQPRRHGEDYPPYRLDAIRLTDTPEKEHTGNCQKDRQSYTQRYLLMEEQNEQYLRPYRIGEQQRRCDTARHILIAAEETYRRYGIQEGKKHDAQTVSPPDVQGLPTPEQNCHHRETAECKTVNQYRRQRHTRLHNRDGEKGNRSECDG